MTETESGAVVCLVDSFVPAPLRQTTSAGVRDGSFALLATSDVGTMDDDIDEARPPSAAHPAGDRCELPPAKKNEELVPAKVLDDAKATITLLMQEIEYLRAELEDAVAATPDNGGGYRAVMQRGENECPSLSPIRAGEHHNPCSSPNGGEGEHEESKNTVLFDGLKRTVQQRNRAIQQLQKQLSLAKVTEASLQGDLRAKRAEVEKHRKREQTLVHQIEHLKRDVATRDALLQSMQQGQAEMLLGLEARLMAMRAHELTAMPPWVT